MSDNKRPIGIDLGTSRCAVATLDESGRTAMVPSAEGDLLTPSILFFGDDGLIVGKNARAGAVSSPDRGARWFRRDLGGSVCGSAIAGKGLKPEAATAAVLAKLRGDWTEPLGEDVAAVVTVPGCHGEAARNAIAHAADAANVPLLAVVDEPTAIAAAYGEQYDYLTEDGSLAEQMTVMVFDLGGGKFDAAIIRVAAGRISTVASGGDPRLGGLDWDVRVARWAAEQFLATHGLDPREDPAALALLLRDAEEAKITLAARSKASLRVDCRGMRLDLTLTRDMFHEITADLFQRVADTTVALLTSAQLDWGNLSRVLLVGGATRMPRIVEMIQAASGKVPDRAVNVDEAVARGAALIAANLLAVEEGGLPEPPLKIEGKLARTLAFEKISYEYDQVKEQQIEYRKAVPLIRRGESLPATQSRRFATEQDGQEAITVELLEGESEWSNQCTRLGQVIVSDLPEGVSVGWPVEVTFSFDAYGRMRTRAEVPGTHRDMTHELVRAGGLDDASKAAWGSVLSKSSGFKSVAPLLMPMSGPLILSEELRPATGVVAEPQAPPVEAMLPEATDEADTEADAPTDEKSTKDDKKTDKDKKAKAEPSPKPAYAPTYTKSEKDKQREDATAVALITGIYIGAIAVGLGLGWFALKALGIW